MSSVLPNLNRRGSARKPSTKRNRSKVCPSCGKRFLTRTKLQAHLVGSLEAMHAEALEHGLTDTANEIAATLNRYGKEQQHG